MERVMSVEDKIRRAEEIYAKRKEGTQRKTATVPVNQNGKKDIKLLKKMIIQIIISLIIYLSFYIIQNNNYIFSEDFLNKANEILSYDINFKQLYEDIKQKIENSGIVLKKEENQGEANTIEENQGEVNTIEENAIGGAEEIIEEIAETTQTEEISPVKQLSQEEQDIENIKATASFIKPVEGIISSGFGEREPTKSTIPKNHTGVDIAANLGTKIISATEGEVILASEQGDYGKHLKIQIGEVVLVYAHCNKLYVKQGDKVIQGQEIAEVGTTGNSTGPHLHFEIRILGRTINPQKILSI